MQKTLLDSDYNDQIPANTNPTSNVKRHLAYPVKTAKVRIYPLTWQTYPSMAARLYGYLAG
jgi:hypothetical protein